MHECWVILLVAIPSFIMGYNPNKVKARQTARAYSHTQHTNNTTHTHTHARGSGTRTEAEALTQDADTFRELKILLSLAGGDAVLCCSRLCVWLCVRVPVCVCVCECIVCLFVSGCTTVRYAAAKRFAAFLLLLLLLLLLVCHLCFDFSRATLHGDGDGDGGTTN